MKCLSRSAPEAVGIFRKSGVRSRIQKLRDDIEADPGQLDHIASATVSVFFTSYQWKKNLTV